MPIKFRREYLREIQLRYKNARKKEKSAILDEFCQICGYNRKHAIQILNNAKFGSAEIKRPGPKQKYENCLLALRDLWQLTGGICSKKLKAAIPLWLPFYPVTKHVQALLLSISPSTIDRLLRPFKSKFGKGLSSTRPSMKLKTKIPIKLLDGEVKVPGYVEGDTVAHCGSSLAGEFANSLTVTDLLSGWTEIRATWTKDAEAIKAQLKKIEDRLPFTLIGFASDNGSEFINDVLHSYFKKRDVPVNFVRRRAYKKNDNAHVEQKNWTHVRELFGYDRFDDRRLVAMMNEIYQAYWCPLQNYFIPCMKLESKERIGGAIKKKYDKPKTPAERLCQSPLVPDKDKARIKEGLYSRNPITLRKMLDEKLKEFFQLVEEIKTTRRQTGS